VKGGSGAGKGREHDEELGKKLQNIGSEDSKGQGEGGRGSGGRGAVGGTIKRRRGNSSAKREQFPNDLARRKQNERDGGTQ